ncbi:hypothetical protein GOP47_0025850 [Adiantum capillus-veneris]|uniref:Uncharacterized protein n=1 Tax=Adiantum capillus-veneris TaxID=13818 RepID=A0A9D4Z4I5_ADICA|nr:hypothetical protein GOP47_0025850 [Adiantum capillus-veneris]
MASEDDVFSDAEEEEEEDDDGDADEDLKRSLRRKSYEKHLPELKTLLKETFGDAKPNLVTDRTEKCCAVCPTLQWFKGWKALLGHAETFKKKRIQQHRGYAEAIKEALRVHGTSTSRSDIAPTETRTASFNPEAASNHVIVWPPILLVEAMDRRMDLHETMVDVLNREVPNICMPQFIQVRSYRGLLMFRGEAVGYLEAMRVSKLFSELNKRSDQNSRVHGYVATPKDMKVIDPERKLVKWTEESYYLKVQHAQKKDKEEHDNEKAQLKEMELRVETLAENELKFKERRERFEQLIEFKQKQIENQKKRADEMEKLHHDRMQRLEGQFQNEIKIFEATSAARLKRWREQLQHNEKRLEEERVKRLKEIEGLQKQFQTIRQDIKQKEAQKAVEKELEVMQRKQNFMAEMAKAEATFNEHARGQESELQVKQHHEEMKLMEEAKREREELLKEWLEKQKNEKKEKEEPVPVQEEASECCSCMDALDENNRAFLIPSKSQNYFPSSSFELQMEFWLWRLCKTKSPEARSKGGQMVKQLPSMQATQDR